jgi:hypothetical protein
MPLAQPPSVDLDPGEIAQSWHGQILTRTLRIFALPDVVANAILIETTPRGAPVTTTLTSLNTK